MRRKLHGWLLICILMPMFVDSFLLRFPRMLLNLIPRLVFPIPRLVFSIVYLHTSICNTFSWSSLSSLCMGYFGSMPRAFVRSTFGFGFYNMQKSRLLSLCPNVVQVENISLLHHQPKLAELNLLHICVYFVGTAQPKVVQF